jgi:aminoglycoside 6'-N-acetyltransferase
MAAGVGPAGGVRLATSTETAASAPRVDPRIVLRPMTLADVPLLDAWDRAPHVIAATSDDPEAPKAFGDAYWPDELALVAPDYRYFMATIEGRPFGGLQIIDPHTEATHYWGAIEPDLRAIDIWIGATADLGRGYGSMAMRRAFQFCFAAPQVTAIVIDPLASNGRAHRFYRRLGFRAEERRLFGADDCLVHRLTRQDWRSRFPND